MAIGDFGSLIDSEEFDTVNAYPESIIEVAPNIWAIPYRGGTGVEGWLKTHEIDSLGNIGPAIDSFKFDATRCIYTDIIHVSGDVYLVAYKGVNDDGFMFTITIDSSGNIGAAKIDQWEFDSVLCNKPRLIHISGTVYGIVYQDTDGDGQLKTFSVANDGTITSAWIDTLEFDATFGDWPRILHVSGNWYIIAYTGPTADGIVGSIDIDNSGNIGAAFHDTLTFEIGSCSNPFPFHVSGDYYGVAYMDVDSDSWIKTFTVDSSGNISAAVIDSLEFEPDTGHYPMVIPVGSGTGVFLVYGANPASTKLRTYPISNVGVFGSLIDSLELMVGYAGYGRLGHIEEDIYAIWYQGAGADGFISSFNVTSEEAVMGPGGAPAAEALVKAAFI